MYWSVLGSKLNGLPINWRTDVNKHLQYEEHQKLCIQNPRSTEGEHGERRTYPTLLKEWDGWPEEACGPCKVGSSLALLDIL